MYTPKGELHEEFLAVLYQDEILKELKSCKNQKELIAAIKKYVTDIEEEEVQDSLVVIQSYLEEEQESQILTDEDLDGVAGGTRRNEGFMKDKITGLLEKNPKATSDIHSIFQKLQIM